MLTPFCDQFLFSPYNISRCNTWPIKYYFEKIICNSVQCFMLQVSIPYSNIAFTVLSEILIRASNLCNLDIVIMSLTVTAMFTSFIAFSAPFGNISEEDRRMSRQQYSLTISIDWFSIVNLNKRLLPKTTILF